MKRFSLLFVVSFAAMLALSGCARRINYRLVGVQQAYTLTNLHPDQRRKILYSVNYQEDGLIPVCTPVQIQVVSPKKMIFTRLDTHEQYQYIFHRRSLRAPIPAHLDKYFGTECPKNVLDRMSQTDMAGIKAGEVHEGMTKDGVILAIGYPPAHETPDLNADTWKYWTNHFGTFLVKFQKGYVSEIVQ